MSEENGTKHFLFGDEPGRKSRFAGFVFVGLTMLFISSFLLSSPSLISFSISERQLLGTVLLLILLPVFFVLSMQMSSVRTRRELKKIAPYVDPHKLAKTMLASFSIRWFMWVGAILGASYGFYQNSWVIEDVVEQRATLFDVVFFMGNAFLWFGVGFFASWRVYLSIGVSRLGKSFKVDVYDLELTKPFGRIATMDVLIVAASMSFMALQGLDAEFRWVNYQSGSTVGIIAATVLFILPIYGIHGAIKAAKDQRVAELKSRLLDIPRDNLEQLELLSAHIARVQGLSSWPIDMALLRRIFFYGVIPPVAWVLAALVENLVDQF